MIVKNEREKSKVSFGLLFFHNGASIDLIFFSLLSVSFSLVVSPSVLLKSSLLMTAKLRCCRRRCYVRMTSLFSLSLEKYSFARALYY